jgi:prepilin-type N-terminal cleavage/methylation domain-containing protein
MDTQRGFTIIESILVLAITGLVVAVVLVGIGTSLRSERYRDATNQTIDYFQGVYDVSANIANDRPSSDTCTSSGIGSGGGQGRGTSACLVMGYMLRSTDGMTITKQQVIARVDASKLAGEDQKQDVQTLIDSSMVESTESSSYTLDWGVQLLSSGNPAALSMLVVRAPLSGVVHTYIDTASGTRTIAQLLSSSSSTDSATFCIDPKGVFDAGTQQNGFTIDANATNSSNVRQLAAGDCV